LEIGVPGTLGVAFRKVLRAVGEVVDNVSKRKLVERFANAGGIERVFSDSLGRLDEIECNAGKTEGVV
jgi:hypothetical protein